MAGELRLRIPEDAEILRQYATTITVWRDGDRVYKQQPKHMTDNEFYFLGKMQDTGYVPGNIVQEDIETISMEFVENEPVSDPIEFMSHYAKVLVALANNNIAHGDLTEYAIIVNGNKPIIIDFAEARHFNDLIPPKRPESDADLLMKAMKKLCHGMD